MMSKLRYLGGFKGPGRHRLQIQHDGTRDHMRILFKREDDITAEAGDVLATGQEIGQAS